MAFLTAYKPLPITFTRGEGIWLYDQKKQAYLDAFTGIAVCGLGHSHPNITHAIQDQAAKLIHTSNMVHIEAQERLAHKLNELTQMEQFFFGNSGAEANETAIKLTRLYGHQKGIETPSIVVMEGAFHGRTMATLSASGSRKVQAGFEPLVPGFVRAPYNDLEAIHTIAANRDDIVAIMLEPIQGEGGILLPNELYLKSLSELCKQKGWLLILDEIQTGNARTGHLYSYMESGIMPDIITTAKGLGNGMPIGACMMSGHAANLLKPGHHGSTFGGNPLACATALAVLEVFEKEDICNLVRKNSRLLRDMLNHRLGEHPMVKTIRGKGYMIGVELTKPALEIRLKGLENGLILNVTAEKVIRLLPALIMNEEEITELVNRLEKTIDQFYSSQPS